MNGHEQIPAGVDTERPSSARVYDYWLGGAHNFEVDRRVAEQVLAVYPNMRTIARINRAFLRRAVQHLVDAGIHQFLDIGSGIPTVGHVHGVAQASAPDATIVYVDIDPIAVAHSNDILAGNDNAAAIQEDLRHPEQIIANPVTSRLIDPDQPVAVLLVSMLHFIPDREDPRGLIQRLLDPLASGSLVAISHATNDGPQDMATGAQLSQRSGMEMTLRSHAQVTALLDGYEVLPPGIVWAPLWRPDGGDDLGLDEPAASANYAGVARKP